MEVKKGKIGHMKGEESYKRSGERQEEEKIQ